MSNQIEELANLIKNSNRTIILTGAGISTDSGLPDFRSDNGFWKSNKPIYFNDFIKNEQSRILSWKRNIELNNLLEKINPNDGHRFVSKLLDLNDDNFLITQNIDGLHQRVFQKNTNIIEIHGNATSAKCLECKKEYSLKIFHQAARNDEPIPTCHDCSGLIKVATISFGQPMNTDDLINAQNLTADCDLFLVLGSSLVVQPVASLPKIALENNAKLAIINNDETPYDGLADIVINAKINDVISEINLG